MIQYGAAGAATTLVSVAFPRVSSCPFFLYLSKNDVLFVLLIFVAHPFLAPCQTNVH